MKRWIILAAVLMLAAAPASAQKAAKKAEPRGGLAFAWLLPQDGLKDTHDKGWGIHLLFAYQVADKMDLSVTTGYDRVLADADAGAMGAEDFTMWEFTAGPRARIDLFYIGIEGGYFTKIDEWGLVPNAGIRYKRFDVGYRMKTSGDTKIHAIRAGYFF